MYWVKCITGCVLLTLTLGMFGFFTDYAPLSVGLFRWSPTIEIESTELDLGWIDESKDVVNVEFEVRNAGRRELVLSPTTRLLEDEFVLGTDEFVVQPGETRTLTLEIDRSCIESYFCIKLPYEANDCSHPEIVFVVKGKQHQNAPKKKKRSYRNSAMVSVE